MKAVKILSLLVFLNTVLPASLQARSMVVQQNKVPTKSFYQKFRTLPLFPTAFPALNLTQAKNLLQQKGGCIFNYKSCSKRDLLALSSAFGFMLGYGFEHFTLFDLGFARGREAYKQKYGQELSIYKMVAAIILVTSILPNSPLVSRLDKVNLGLLLGLCRSIMTGDELSIGSEVLGQFSFLLRELGLFGVLLIGLSVFSEVRTIATEFKFALKSDSKSSIIKNIKKYMQMNAGCIWAEEKCVAKNTTPQDRRQGLYFLLGFLAGMGVKVLKNLTWGKKEYLQKKQQQKIAEESNYEKKLEKSLVKISDSDVDVINSIPGLKKKTAITFRNNHYYKWQDVLGVSEDATKKDATAAYRKLAVKYHPDKNPNQKELAEKITRILNAAYGISGASGKNK